jgi:hypothetical protein
MPRSFALIAVGLLVLTGCASSRLSVTSYQDPYFPETYHAAVRDAVYDVGPTGDIHAVGKAESQTDAGRTTQYLHVHIFWKPHPGKTWAESSTTDAVLRYVLVTDKGSATYTGTGFAFPKKARWGDDYDITVESARLRLESKTGDMPDVLGPAQLTGRLHVRHDEPAAAHQVRDAQLASMAVHGG